MHYKKGTMPHEKQLQGPQSAPRHLLAPGTRPPEKISGPNRYDVPKSGWSASYRQKGKRGGHD